MAFEWDSLSRMSNHPLINIENNSQGRGDKCVAVSCMRFGVIKARPSVFVAYFTCPMIMFMIHHIILMMQSQRTAWWN